MQGPASHCGKMNKNPFNMEADRKIEGVFIHFSTTCSKFSQHVLPSLDHHVLELVFAMHSPISTSP